MSAENQQPDRPARRPLTRQERALKRLVIVLGVLLVAGFIVLIITIGFRIANRDWGGAGTPAEINAEITRPAGGALAGMTADDDRLYLRFNLASGEDLIVIVDAATGEKIGELRIPNP